MHHSAGAQISTRRGSQKSSAWSFIATASLLDSVTDLVLKRRRSETLQTDAPYSSKGSPFSKHP